ncbi:MAG: ferritin [Akkermansia sp.]
MQPRPPPDCLSGRAARGGRGAVRRTTPCVWESPIDAFAAVLEHEKRVSASVDALVTLSRAEQDYATESIMMRYVQEQVEEENAAADIVDCMRLAEGNRAGLLRIDRRMGKRKPGQRSDIRR